MNSLRQLIALLVVLIAAFVIVGCKEKEDDDDLDVRIEPTEENVCSQYADVVCNNAFQCCLGTELETQFGIEITTTESDCRRDMQLVCEETFATELYSLSLQRLMVDTTQLELCLNEVMAPVDECFPVLPSDVDVYDICDTNLIFVGQVAAGGDCIYGHDCVDGAICDADRTCKMLPTGGEDCGGLYSCADGFYCDTDFEDPMMAQTCRRRVAVDGGCSWDLNMGIAYTPCEEELFCEMDPTFVEDPDVPDGEETPGVCTALKVVGTPCEGNGECASTECLEAVCEDGSGYCYTADDCMGTCSISMLDCNSVQPCNGTYCNGGQQWDGFEVVDLTGNACADDMNCGGVCGNDNTLNCLADADCETSVCSDIDGTTPTITLCPDPLTGLTCADYVGTGSVCLVTPDTCDGVGACAAETCEGQPACVGTPTCADNYYVQNYCTMGLHLLMPNPLPIP